jgi:hypothetical protein
LPPPPPPHAESIRSASPSTADLFNVPTSREHLMVQAGRRPVEQPIALPVRASPRPVPRFA